MTAFIERIPKGARSAPPVSRSVPISIVLQAALVAAGDAAPGGPHHLGGPVPYSSADLGAAIPEWCARQVEDLVASADRPSFEATLRAAACFRADRDSPRPPDGRVPRRLNALAIAEFAGASAIRFHEHVPSLERLVARAAAFTVELLKKRTSEDRVRAFVLDLDHHLAWVSAVTLMRRVQRQDGESLLRRVVARGGWRGDYRGIDEWALLELVDGSEAFCFERAFHENEGWVVAPPGKLRQSLAKVLEPQPRWARRLLGARSVEGVFRTIELQAIASAILRALPERGKLLVGMIRLLAEAQTGTSCHYCAALWGRSSDGPNCELCTLVLECGLQQRLPTLDMLIAETRRALEMTDELANISVLERWIREAERHRRCPMCERVGDRRVPTAQGWICESCLILPVVVGPSCSDDDEEGRGVDGR